MAVYLKSVSNNLNQFPNLGRIEFVVNRLTNLDLTNCSNLNSISIGDNNLVSINLTNCFNLAEINLNNNNLTSIDITPFPLLQNINFNVNPNLNNVIFDTLPNMTGVAIEVAQLPSSLVDAILIALDNNGLASDMFYCNLDGGTNGIPGVDGLAAAASLQLKEWTVTYNT
jgi:hypothetical protein